MHEWPPQAQQLAYNRFVLWTYGLVALSACGRIGFDAGDAPPAGPIGWWKLGDGSGTVAADSSGHGDNGVLTAGISWVAGRNGSGAISMDGAANHEVDIGAIPLLELTGSMTLAAWVYPIEIESSGDNVIISRDDVFNMFEGWSLKAGTTDCGSLAFAMQIAAAPTMAVELCSSTMPGTDAWYHVAGVYDATTPALHVYIDGVLDDGPLCSILGCFTTVPTSQYEPTSLVHVEIGNDNPEAGQVAGGNSGFTGMLQDVRMYDRALTATEIAVVASQ